MDLASFINSAPKPPPVSSFLDGVTDDEIMAVTSRTLFAPAEEAIPMDAPDGLIPMDPKTFFRKRKWAEVEEEGEETFAQWKRVANSSTDVVGDYLFALFTWRMIGKEEGMFAFERASGKDTYMSRFHSYSNTTAGRDAFVRDARNAVKIHLEPSGDEPAIIDIDAGAYDNLRSCECNEKQLCETCWPLIKFSVYYAVATLKNAGVEPLVWFSGRRGFHIAVSDEGWRKMDGAKYPLINLVSPPRIPGTAVYAPKRFFEPGPDGRMREERIYHYPQRDMLKGRNMIPVSAAMEYLIQHRSIFHDERSLFRVASHVSGGISSVAASMLIQYIKPALAVVDSPRYSDDSASNSGLRFENLLLRWQAWAREYPVAASELMISILSPRIDQAAAGRSHLMGLPGLAHPSTGALCAMFTDFMAPEARFAVMTRRLDEMSPEERRQLIIRQTAILQDATRALQISNPVAKFLADDPAPAPEPVHVTSVTPTKPRIVRRT